MSVELSIEFFPPQTGDHFHIEVAAYPEWHPQAKSPHQRGQVQMPNKLESVTPL